MRLRVLLEVGAFLALPTVAGMLLLGTAMERIAGLLDEASALLEEAVRDELDRLGL